MNTLKSADSQDHVKNRINILSQEKFDGKMTNEKTKI